MRILYIFPHPDDESFGPARAMAAQKRQGHDVYLLTLTRGEATKVRHKFGWTLEQMGEVRYREMMDVRTTLDLTDIRVLNLPDGGLKSSIHGRSRRRFAMKYCASNRTSS